jgi:membrane protein YqaA with SNARE-associated domain
MIGYLHKSWSWFKERAESPHTKGWLLLLSFTESAIFVIPPDPLLAAIILAGSPRWVYYTIITTVASVLGAIFGYILGDFFFDTVGVLLINTYGLGSELEYVQKLFEGNAFGVILFSAITPVPFKIFVLSAGFLKINLVAFLSATILGRGLRYTLVAYTTHALGERALHVARKYSTAVTIVSIIVFAFYILYIFLN